MRFEETNQNPSGNGERHFNHRKINCRMAELADSSRRINHACIRNGELLVAEKQDKVVGFIHYIMHEDIIDGGLNSFITAFYVAPEFRNRGIGSSLLRHAIRDALGRGALGMETSTANPDARRLYEKHHFRQFMGRSTMGEVLLELYMKKHKRSQA